MVANAPRRGRVRYADAGRAMRAALEHAVAAKVSCTEMRVLAAVFALTASYSKLEDSTSAKQIGAMVYGVEADRLGGRRRQTVSVALKRLGDLKVIRYQAGRGRGARLLVGLNVADARDIPADVEEGGSGQTSRGDATFDDDDNTEGRGDPSPMSRESIFNVARQGGNTEKDPEDDPETSEKGNPRAAAERVRAIRDLAGLLRDSDRFHVVRPQPDHDAVEDGPDDDVDDLVEVEEADDELLEKWRRAVRELDDKAA